MKNPVTYLVSKVWQFSYREHRKVVFYVSLFVVANAIVLCEPLVVAKVLNTIQQHGITRDNLLFVLFLLFLYVLLTVASWTFHGPARVIEEKNSFLVAKNYRQYLMHGVMSLPAAWHVDHHSGDTIETVNRGTRSLSNFAGDSFEVIEVLTRFIFAFAALIYFNVHAIYIVLLFTTVIIFVILRFDRRLEKQMHQLNSAANNVSATVFDILSNITTVIVLRIEKMAERNIVRQIMKPFRLFSRHRVLVETKWFTVSILLSLMMFAVLGSYVTSSVLRNAPILVGTLYALYGYLQRVEDSMFRFTWLYGNLLQQSVDVQNSEQLASVFAKHTTKEATEQASPTWKTFEIRDLRFSYGDAQKKLHLDNISFSFQRGENIALVGESGSGKTTTLKVLRGLYDPQYADVFLDGRLQVDGLASLAEGMALVPQDPELFASTIKHNLTMGFSVDSKKIKKFVRMAEFHDVVERLPHKINSSIVERGVNLSGGEKQRLALARGLLMASDKQILLLDEPTSSVDVATERNIFSNIFKEFQETTIIASVHRLHLLPLFDQILLFDQGRIIASGSYTQLHRSSAHFRELLKKSETNLDVE